VPCSIEGGRGCGGASRHASERKGNNLKSPRTSGQNLALTVLYVPSSIEGGRGCGGASRGLLLLLRMASFRALSGRPKFTGRRHKFNKDSLLFWLHRVACISTALSPRLGMYLLHRAGASGRDCVKSLRLCLHGTCPQNPPHAPVTGGGFSPG